MFQGSCVALVTPFHNGELDERKLKDLVEFQISNGTSAIVPCGTTGESSTLSHKEHGRVIDRVIKYVNKRIQVIAGAGSNSTREAVELARHAKASGADAVLSITPYYNKPTQHGLKSHFQAVAREASLPIVVYNVPGRTGVNMLPATVIELAQAEKNIVAVKEASGNIDQSSEIIRTLGSTIDVLSGDDALTLPILSIGGKGVISVIANIVPKDVADMCAAWEKGDIETARALHLKMYPLVKALFFETNPVPVKTAASWLGLCAADVRLPLVPLTQAGQEKLKSTMKEYGLELRP